MFVELSDGGLSDLASFNDTKKRKVKGTGMGTINLAWSTP